MTQNPKIYISGQITGLPYPVAQENFKKGTEKASKLISYKANPPQFVPVNPMELNHNHDESWESYMRVDLKALLDCQAIYMLKGWHNSAGANIEYNLATDLGLEIFFES